MTTPRVTVPVEDLLFYKLKYLILEQSEGEWTDEMIVRDAHRFANHIRPLLSAAPAPEGGAVSETELRDAIALILPMAKGYAAAHPVGSNQSYVDYVENLITTREEAPAEAGEIDLYDDKVQAGIAWTMRQWGEALGLKTWTQGDGSESVEGDVGAEIHTILVDAGLRDPETNEMAALRAQPQAREEAQPVEKPAPFDQGGIGHAMYQAFHAYRADYVLSTDGADYEPTPFERDLIEDFFAGLMAEEAFFGPIRALYDTHPATDALREDAAAWTALADLVSWFTKPVQGQNGMVWVIPAGEQGADDAVASALAALQAEQKGGAA
ncbi:hypothetical protein [Brevundimonas diminuta]|uniref:hypothetical protein n=1 Tax=Brevundimonas diminuta TaxID=293 RepID=UPI003D9A8849